MGGEVRTRSMRYREEEGTLVRNVTASSHHLLFGVVFKHLPPDSHAFLPSSLSLPLFFLLHTYTFPLSSLSLPSPSRLSSPLLSNQHGCNCSRVVATAN